MQRLIPSGKPFRHLDEVNTTAVEMNTELRSLLSPSSWENRLSQRRYSMLHEVLRIDGVHLTYF